MARLIQYWYNIHWHYSVSFYMICKKSIITKITVSKLHIDIHTSMMSLRGDEWIHYIDREIKKLFPFKLRKTSIINALWFIWYGIVFRLLHPRCLILAASTLYGLWWSKYSLYHPLHFTLSSAAILRKIITMAMSLEIAWDQLWLEEIQGKELLHHA